VNPKAPKLATTVVAHRKEVEVTPKSISHLAKIGRADARGGLNRARAFERVAKVVSRFNGPCNARTLHTNGIAITPAPGGWRVTVKLAGGLKGAAAWTVRGKLVAPANGVATKLASGCR
jgi:proline racemase